MEIGTLLLKLRRERRLSQSEVAIRIGVCQSAYCAWESNRAVPKVHHYGPLATVFGIGIQELLPNNQADGLSVPVFRETVTSNASAGLQEALINSQQETIALLKLRIKSLEDENYQLKKIKHPVDIFKSDMIMLITFVLNFSNILLNSISEALVIS